jgi:hypothetical protein
MLTEDAFRRRELADLGIKAEVRSDGHTIVATFDRPQFDALVAAGRGSTDRHVSDADYHEGFEDGSKAGWDAALIALNEMQKVVDGDSKAKAS